MWAHQDGHRQSRRFERVVTTDTLQQTATDKRRICGCVKTREFP